MWSSLPTAPCDYCQDHESTPNNVVGNAVIPTCNAGHLLFMHLGIWRTYCISKDSQVWITSTKIAVKLLAFPRWLHQHFLVLIQAEISKTKKPGGLLAIKPFCQVYGFVCWVHNIGITEILPMGHLYLDFIFAEILVCPLVMPSSGYSQIPLQ